MPLKETEVAKIACDQGIRLSTLRDFREWPVAGIGKARLRNRRSGYVLPVEANMVNERLSVLTRKVKLGSGQNFQVFIQDAVIKCHSYRIGKYLIKHLAGRSMGLQ